MIRHAWACAFSAILFLGCAGAGVDDSAGGPPPDEMLDNSANGELGQGGPDAGGFGNNNGDGVGGGRGGICPGAGPWALSIGLAEENEFMVLSTGAEFPFAAQVEAGATALVSLEMGGFGEENHTVNLSLKDGENEDMVLAEATYENLIPICDADDVVFLYDLSLLFTPPLNQFSLDGRAATLHAEVLADSGGQATAELPVVLVALEDDG
jgi:hypothetical protein